MLASKVVLVAIIMEIFGRSFHFVWCGVFGRREIVDVLKKLSVPCLISSYYFSEPYLTGSLCGETNIFLFWIYLTFVIFVLDLFTPVYFLCTWVSLSFDINESLLLIKKKIYIYIYIYQSLEPLKMRIMYLVDYYWAIEKNAYIKKIMRNKRIFQLK